ncbi:WbqC family protein [Methyloradius palustris]|uniref:WbqC-like family protein n=1 Tax=Methyloradius palustris TaxID=2778876 RepID=A0A8D5GBJ5_9PROT|nr:WbqC family protein [Methyloradius palustris]BCM25246.1 hypothetical protein ZMTM_15050 [Methyloradius palustris]
MKLAIMQPYFLPYIGYFQLIAAVDVFVIYDNIKYTKKGWINRNRYFRNGKDELFSLPLKSDSDFLNISERFISESFDASKLLNQLSNAYSKAPYFYQTLPLLEKIINYQEKNLFNFIYYSVVSICEYLEIDTKIVISSTLDIDHELKGTAKVFAICESLGASQYINAIGGVELYGKDDFFQKGIALKFIKSNITEYKQFENNFIPWLSMIDCMMFNSKETLIKWLTTHYEFI